MTIVKLQIPIDRKVRDSLERRAHSLGFDSAQAYIRVWAKAEADGRKLDFDSKSITLSAKANERYAQIIDDLDVENKSGKTKVFNSVDDFMKDLKE